MYIKNRRTINKLIWFSLRNRFDLTRLMPMFAIILSFVKSACEFYIYHGQVNYDFGPNGNRNCRIAFNSGSYHSSYGTFVCCIEKKNTRGETSTSLLFTSNRSSSIHVWRSFLDFLSTKTETYWSKKMRSRKAIAEAFTVGQLTPLSFQQ